MREHPQVHVPRKIQRTYPQQGYLESRLNDPPGDRKPPHGRSLCCFRILYRLKEYFEWKCNLWRCCISTEWCEYNKPFWNLWKPTEAIYTTTSIRILNVPLAARRLPRNFEILTCADEMLHTVIIFDQRLLYVSTSLSRASTHEEKTAPVGKYNWLRYHRRSLCCF